MEKLQVGKSSRMEFLIQIGQKNIFPAYVEHLRQKNM